jgi:HEAT repeat protein
LQDSNQEVAESAAIALGALAHPGPALLLTEILADSAAGRTAVGRPEVPYRTRAFAAYGLGLIGRRVERQDVRRYIVRHLARALEADRTASSDLGVACVAALGIVHVDPRALGEARVGSSDSASLSRDAQAAMLLQYFTKLQRADLLRAYVPVSLARSVDAGTPQMLDDSITALCAVLEPRAREPALVQESAAMALGSISIQNEAQGKRILAALQESAAHGERLAGNLALISLARVAADTFPPGSSPDAGALVRNLYIRELTRGPTATRPWAALALGIYEHMRLKAGRPPSGESRAAVRGALVDRRGPNEIGAYCVAAGLMRDTLARDVLVHILEDGSDDDVRAHAAIGLGLMEDDAAIAPLRKVLAEARYRPVLLRDTSIALGLLGDVRAASHLWTMLAEAKSLGAQSAIASGLGFIGDARSIEPLLGLIGNKDASDRTKAFAAAALGNICDDSLLPWNAAYALDVNYVLPPATLYEPAGAAGLLDLL